MKVEKVLSFGKLSDREKGIDLTRHLSGEDRLSLLEDLRQEVAKVANIEYPSRLRRFLTIVKRQ
jgi:hypothetical protein